MKCNHFLNSVFKGYVFRVSSCYFNTLRLKSTYTVNTKNKQILFSNDPVSSLIQGITINFKAIKTKIITSGARIKGQKGERVKGIKGKGVHMLMEEVCYATETRQE